MRKATFEMDFWELKAPFRITGHTFTGADILHVTITENGVSGSGEAAGIYYLNESSDSMMAQAESVKQAIEQGVGREQLLDLLPTGGTRNAIDCALWDFESKLAGTSIWDLTGITPSETTIANTIGIGTLDEMAAAAASLDTPLLKVKLDGEQPVERIAVVRAARPDADIIVDVNQGWTFKQLQEFAPLLKDLGVSMIEQPLPRGGDEELEGYESPIPLCADESCLDTTEFEQASRRYQMINIKLDKTGGLTEALRLAEMTRSRNMGLMIGNMLGTSLGMAPGYVVAQLCDFADLDGALYLKRDREHPMSFVGGVLSAPSGHLWG